MNILDYAEQFKPCRRIEYEAFVCKPPIGSAVLNPVTNYKAIYLLNGKSYLSNREVAYIQQSNLQLYNLLRGSIISASSFVVNIAGFNFIIDYNKLVKDYTFINSSRLTQSRLLSKSFICEEQDGFITPINITLNQAGKLGIKDAEKYLVIPWFKVKYSGALYEEEALYIDKNLKPKFMMYLPYENEDFCVVVENSDEYTAHFIPVSIFTKVYDLRGWSKQLGNRSIVEYPQPTPLFELASSHRGIKTFAVLIESIIDAKYKTSFSSQSGIINDLATEIISRNCLAIEFTMQSCDTFFLAYKKDGYYCMASGDKQVFEDEYDSDIERYLNDVEKLHIRMLHIKDFNSYVDLLIAFLGLDNASIISNYRIPRLTANELVTLAKYTGAEYGNINNYLLGNKCDNDFNAYIEAMFISDIIDRCQVVRDSYHYRGINLDFETASKLKEGYILKHDNFASTSLTSIASYEFIMSASSHQRGILLVFKNTTHKHGAYIDNISAHRNKEFEVLYNIGSDFRLVKKLGEYCELDCQYAEIWLAELIEDKSRGIRKYKYQSDMTEKLIVTIQASGLLREFYINNARDYNHWEKTKAWIELVRYNSEDIHIDIRCDNGVFDIEFMGSIEATYSFSIKEKGYNHLFSYIYSMLAKAPNNIKFNQSALGSFDDKFMTDLIALLTANNFVIIAEKVNEHSMLSPFDGSVDWGSDFDLTSLLPNTQETKPAPMKELRSNRLVLLTADGKPLDLTIELSLTDNKEIKCELIANLGKKSSRKVFTISIEKRFELFELVYKSIVTKFPIDPTRRIKRIFSIVSGYNESYLEFTKTIQGYQCAFDDKIFNISIEGTQVIIEYNGTTIQVNYYEDIYDIAAQIQTLI